MLSKKSPTSSHCLASWIFIILFSFNYVGISLNLDRGGLLFYCGVLPVGCINFLFFLADFFFWKIMSIEYFSFDHELVHVYRVL